jgi:hypothetical protein
MEKRLIFRGFPDEAIHRDFEVARCLLEDLGVAEAPEAEMRILHGSLFSFS